MRRSYEVNLLHSFSLSHLTALGALDWIGSNSRHSKELRTGRYLDYPSMEEDTEENVVIVFNSISTKRLPKYEQ